MRCLLTEPRKPIKIKQKNYPLICALHDFVRKLCCGWRCVGGSSKVFVMGKFYELFFFRNEIKIENVDFLRKNVQHIYWDLNELTDFK
jgi:hypothetical protein